MLRFAAVHRRVAGGNMPVAGGRGVMQVGSNTRECEKMKNWLVCRLNRPETDLRPGGGVWSWQSVVARWGFTEQQRVGLPPKTGPVCGGQLHAAGNRSVGCCSQRSTARYAALPFAPRYCRWRKRWRWLAAWDWTWLKCPARAIRWWRRLLITKHRQRRSGRWVTGCCGAVLRKPRR